jgi:hypothetical protein
VCGLCTRFLASKLLSHDTPIGLPKLLFTLLEPQAYILAQNWQVGRYTPPQSVKTPTSLKPPICTLLITRRSETPTEIWYFVNGRNSRFILYRIPVCKHLANHLPSQNPKIYSTLPSSPCIKNSQNPHLHLHSQPLSTLLQNPPSPPISIS